MSAPNPDNAYVFINDEADHWLICRYSEMGKVFSHPELALASVPNARRRKTWTVNKVLRWQGESWFASMPAKVYRQRRYKLLGITDFLPNSGETNGSKRLTRGHHEISAQATDWRESHQNPRRLSPAICRDRSGPTHHFGVEHSLSNCRESSQDKRRGGRTYPQCLGDTDD